AVWPDGAERDLGAVGRDGPFLGVHLGRLLHAQVDVVPVDVVAGRSVGGGGLLEGEDEDRRVPPPLTDESEFLAVPAPSDPAVIGRIPGDVGGRTAGRRNDVQVAGERAVGAGIDNPLAVRRPVVIDYLNVIDKGLLIAAIRVHRPELAGA